MNKEIKICYIITSMEGGGAGFSMPQIIESLKSNNFNVTVVSCQSRDMGTAHLLEKHSIPYVILGGKKRSLFKELFDFVKFASNMKADVILTSLSRASIIGQLAGKILGIPVVSWKNSADLKWSSWLGKAIPKVWIADSTSVCDFLSAKMNISPSKICNWPPFVAKDLYPMPHRWDAKRPLHIGSTGRLHEVKNYDLLIEGLAHFRKNNPQYRDMVRLSIAGDGPLKSELASLVERHDLHDVVSLGEFIEDIPSFLGELDVYVQPSRFEGFCIAAHEAMNAGLLMLVTPVGELPYSVKNGEQGFILEGDIPQSISAALSKIFKNPNLVYDCGKRSRDYIMKEYGESIYEKRGHVVSEKIKELL